MGQDFSFIVLASDASVGPKDGDFDNCTSCDDDSDHGVSFFFQIFMD
jgi:hypothetical protein